MQTRARKQLRAVTHTLANTNILSELLRWRNARVTDRAKEPVSRTGPLAISTVTLIEIATGLEKAERIHDLDTYIARLRPLQVLNFTAAEARLAWNHLRRARTNGGELGHPLRIENWRA